MLKAEVKAGGRRVLLLVSMMQLSNPRALLFFTVVLHPFFNPADLVLPQIVNLAVIGVAIETTILMLYTTLDWWLDRFTISKNTNSMVNCTGECGPFGH